MVFTTKTLRLFAVIAVIVAAAIVGRGIAAPPAPPATQPAAVNLLPPMATSPQASRKTTIAPVPYRAYMPPATVLHDPRMLPADAPRPLHTQPALDVPPLAQAGLSLPTEAELPVGPPTRIASGDPAAPPIATIAAKPDAGLATLATDPTVGLAPSGALLLFPPPRSNMPPALLLPIPDPSHQVGSIPLNRTSREDPPTADIDRPGPTTLPVK